MKQNISAPVAVVVVVVVLAVIGVVAYSRIFASPSGGGAQPHGMVPPAHRPMSKEEGMAMYRKGMRP